MSDAYDLLASLEEGRIRAALLRMKVDLTELEDAIGSLDNRRRQRLQSKMFSWLKEEKEAYLKETGEPWNEAGMKRYKIFGMYCEKILPLLDSMVEQVS